MVKYFKIISIIGLLGVFFATFCGIWGIYKDPIIGKVMLTIVMFYITAFCVGGIYHAGRN
jgi:hypothetical protein